MENFDKFPNECEMRYSWPETSQDEYQVVVKFRKKLIPRTASNPGIETITSHRRGSSLSWHECAARCSYSMQDWLKHIDSLCAFFRNGKILLEDRDLDYAEEQWSRVNHSWSLVDDELHYVQPAGKKGAYSFIEWDTDDKAWCLTYQEGGEDYIFRNRDNWSQNVTANIPRPPQDLLDKIVVHWELSDGMLVSDATVIEYDGDDKWVLRFSDSEEGMEGLGLNSFKENMIICYPLLTLPLDSQFEEMLANTPPSMDWEEIDTTSAENETEFVPPKVKVTDFRFKTRAWTRVVDGIYLESSDEDYRVVVETGDTSERYYKLVCESIGGTAGRPESAFINCFQNDEWWANHGVPSPSINDLGWLMKAFNADKGKKECEVGYAHYVHKWWRVNDGVDSYLVPQNNKYRVVIVAGDDTSEAYYKLIFGLMVDNTAGRPESTVINNFQGRDWWLNHGVPAPSVNDLGWLMKAFNEAQEKEVDSSTGSKEQDTFIVKAGAPTPYDRWYLSEAWGYIRYALEDGRLMEVSYGADGNWAYTGCGIDGKLGSSDLDAFRKMDDDWPASIIPLPTKEQLWCLQTFVQEGVWNLKASGKIRPPDRSGKVIGWARVKRGGEYFLRWEDENWKVEYDNEEFLLFPIPEDRKGARIYEGGPNDFSQNGWWSLNGINAPEYSDLNWLRNKVLNSESNETD